MDVQSKLWSRCNKSCKTILHCTLFIPCKYIMPASHAARAVEVSIVQKRTYSFLFFQFPLSGLKTWIQQFILEPRKMMAVILLKPLSIIGHAGPAPLPAIFSLKEKKKKKERLCGCWLVINHF